MPVSHPLQAITPKGRASFVKVFRPEAMKEGDKPRYSMTLLIPKDTDPKAIEALKEKLRMAAEKKWGANLPRSLKRGFQDGDAVDQHGAKLFPYEGYEGNWVVKAWSYDKPEIVGRDKQKLTNESDLYSGCWARMVVQAFAFDNPQNKGVSYGLMIVQKLDDDEAFGSSRVTAQEALDDDISQKTPAEEAFGNDDVPW